MNKNLFDSFKNAFDGLLYTIKTQNNIKIHFIIGSIAIIASFFFELTKIEIVLLLLTITFVLVTEMINTAIEKAIDAYTKKYHPIAKIAKNVSAGAVLLAAINSVIVGYFIFIHNYIQRYIQIKVIYYLPLLSIVFFIIIIKIKNRSK